jgi:hypothetical protein
MAKLAAKVVEVDARVEVADAADAVEIGVTILVMAGKATRARQTGPQTTRVRNQTQIKHRPNSVSTVLLRNRSAASICRKANQRANRGGNRDNPNPNRTPVQPKRLRRFSPINRSTSSRIAPVANQASRIRYFRQGQDRLAAATSSD